MSSYAEVSSVPNYLSFTITNAAIGGKWMVKITNSNAFNVDVEYNSKLCFNNDAQYFANLSDVISTTILANSTKTVYIYTLYLH